MRRERALAYAFSHQVNSSSNYFFCCQWALRDYIVRSFKRFEMAADLAILKLE